MPHPNTNQFGQWVHCPCDTDQEERFAGSKLCSWGKWSEQCLSDNIMLNADLPDFLQPPQLLSTSISSVTTGWTQPLQPSFSEFVYKYPQHSVGRCLHSVCHGRWVLTGNTWHFCNWILEIKESYQKLHRLIKTIFCSPSWLIMPVSIPAG